jgi:hypothetical protein
MRVLRKWVRCTDFQRCITKGTVFMHDETASPQAPCRHKSISRVDHESKRMHGWLVRVHFRGERRSKFFGDKRHGGKEPALDAAIAFRDAAEHQLGKPRTDRVVVGLSSRSTTGVQGVHRITKTQQTSGGGISFQPVYEVTWSPAPGVIKCTSVAITKHGEQEVLRRAIAIRKQKEAEVYNAQGGAAQRGEHTTGEDAPLP